MKRITLFGAATAIALTALASGAMAHSNGPRAGGAGGMMQRGPIFDFAQTDADGDGKVTMEEIMAAGQARLDEAFTAMDADADGSVTKDEITAFMAARAEAERAARRDQAAQRMLDFADADDDGVLTKDEVFPQPKGDGSFFTRFDTDEDGAISEEEFAAAQDRFQKRMGDGPRGQGQGQGGYGREHGGQRGFGRDHGGQRDGMMPFFFGQPQQAPTE